ncbi:MAG: TRC40/GET3/ArsA family transport-energizing ATPase [Anaerolineae bacterium]|jgi:arsenite-transporting ATPase|nr:TRC40/GET3/ArsA family transport-energizing ATPase [Anaerolineae bacterium]MDH7472444.1 TRC40/GET3/ArsA family transport-energizing ATPase [Anaerolineae bacterium]
MRILLYTGKGGVGKTTVSAATALRCADLGYRTVVVSTDAAHSLADAFDMALGAEPTPILPNLWGQEIDVLHQMEKHWGDVQRYMATVLAWKGLEGIIAEELTVLPGMDELASLLQIVYLHDTGDYDVIIIDCAPTGATLQLLTLPEVGRWYLMKIFPLEKKAVQISRPLLRAVLDLPMPDDELFDTIEELIKGLDRMKALLTDPDKSSVRLVLNPEKMVVKEAQRAFTYLNLYGYRTDAVISNRLIPQDVSDGYFTGWKGIQARYSQLVEEAFAPLPILTVPLFEQEVVGHDMLRRMAEAIYGEDDPTRFYYVGQTQQVLKQDGTYQLRIPLPFVRKEDIQLIRSSGDELIVRIGNHKRNILLPHVLATLEVQKARQEGDWLVITFQEEERP